MPRTNRRSPALSLLLVLSACSATPEPAPLPGSSAAPTARSTPAPANSAGDPGKTVGDLGDACTTEQPFSQGTCGGGFLCAPFPGGYCASFCGLGGPCSGVCAETGRAGEVCLRGCSSSADCREGYVCDAAWKACTVPRFVAPRAPACHEKPLARKAFGKPVQLSTGKSPGVYTFEPAAAIARDGSVAAAYIALGKMGDKNPLAVSVLSHNGTVDRDRPFTTDRENHFDPWMARDRDGKLHLVWLGFDGGRAPERRMMIGYATSIDGKTWSVPVPVHDAAHDCPDEMPGCMDKPMIAIGPDDKDRKKDAIYVAYFSEAAEGMKLVRSEDGGKTFSPSSPVGDGAYGDLEVADDGTLHVTFVSMNGEGPPPDRYGDPRNAVMYTQSKDGGRSFEKPRAVSPTGEPIPFFFSNPQVAIDTRRKLVYVAYPAGTPDGRWDIFLATSRDGGASFSRVKVNDDRSCANHRTPQMALGPTGAVHLVWTENRSGTGGLAYARCDSGGQKCGPNEAVTDRPMTSYSLARFTPRWLGEYGALLPDPAAQKLHAVFTATTDEDGKSVARIFAATATLD